MDVVFYELRMSACWIPANLGVLAYEAHLCIFSNNPYTC
jgi:hypothetical protein